MQGLTERVWSGQGQPGHLTLNPDRVRVQGQKARVSRPGRPPAIHLRGGPEQPDVGGEGSPLCFQTCQAGPCCPSLFWGSWPPGLCPS